MAVVPETTDSGSTLLRQSSTVVLTGLLLRTCEERGCGSSYFMSAVEAELVPVGGGGSAKERDGTCDDAREGPRVGVRDPV